jgi:predicted transcriptional regulator
MKPTIMNFRDFMDQMVAVAEGRQVAPNFHGKRVFASPAAREHFMRRQALTDIRSVHSALRLLSGPNHDLIKRIAAGKFSSLAELAAQSGRAESNLNRTLKKLERLGLVIMQPGAGRTLKPVLAVRSLRVELDLVEGTAKRLEAATARAPRKTVAKPDRAKPRGGTRAAVHR